MFQKILFVSLSVASVFCVIKASTYESPPSTNPEYPGKCYNYGEKIGYDLGESLPEGKCYRAICNKDYSYKVLGCGSMSVTDELAIIKNSNLPYPKCCGIIKLKSELTEDDLKLLEEQHKASHPNDIKFKQHDDEEDEEDEDKKERKNKDDEE